MTFYLWNLMYNILGISLSVVAIILIYKVYIVSKSEMSGDSRTG